MIIYNITCSVDPDISDEWLRWMQDHHIPKVMNTGIFIETQINRVISDQKDELVTYAIQYTCKSMKDLHKYQIKFAPSLQKDHIDKYGSKVVVFRTLLDVIYKI